jgi:hypothetical protein
MAGMTRSSLAKLQRAPSDRTPATLSAGNLPALDRASLRQLWRELFSSAAPSRASHALLVYALAYRMQENAHGGLSALARTRLRAIAQQLGPGTSPPKNTAARFAPGTRLIRQWRAQRHEVTVLEKGYAYRICYALEIDPLYVDVSIRRWQAHSGGCARLAPSGESFAQREAKARPANKKIST